MAEHVPVLLSRILELFAPALTDRPATIVDATIGLGGHSAALLAAHPQLHVIALDRDTDALARSRERLARYEERVTFVHAVYDQLPKVLSEQGLSHVDGVLFDLGVSSMQLDVAERGFAYAKDAPLDMRMNQVSGHTAADVLNTYSLDELTTILRDFGEERFARRIAKAIVAQRENEPFVHSAQLVELLYSAIPAATRRAGGHPAKRTFQALRIEVNNELDVLKAAIPAAVGALSVGGRIVVEAYQSLEDRLVKQALTTLSTSRTPAGLPVELPGHEPELKLLTRGAEKADEQEIEQNPRAASVRLRAAERIREAAT